MKKFKKILLSFSIAFKNFFFDEKHEGAFQTDGQTLLCLEAARLTVDHVVNF